MKTDWNSYGLGEILYREADSALAALLEMTANPVVIESVCKEAIWRLTELPKRRKDYQAKH